MEYTNEEIDTMINMIKDVEFKTHLKLLFKKMNKIYKHDNEYNLYRSSMFLFLIAKSKI